MIRRPIRNLHSNKPMPPRFCDVVIEDDAIFLEQKIIDRRDRTQYARIPWDDVVYQVEAAKQEK